MKCAIKNVLSQFTLARVVSQASAISILFLCMIRITTMAVNTQAFVIKFREFCFSSSGSPLSLQSCTRRHCHHTSSNLSLAKKIEIMKSMTIRKHTAFTAITRIISIRITCYAKLMHAKRKK